MLPDLDFVLCVSTTRRTCRLAVADLVPSGELRVVAVGQRDDALKVGVDHSAVQRPAFADDPVGERDPALGPFACRT